jgi:hypothetical protein
MLFRRINRTRGAGGGTSAALDALVGIDYIHGIPFGNGLDRADGQTGSNAVTTVRDEVSHITPSSSNCFEMITEDFCCLFS